MKHISQDKFQDKYQDKGFAALITAIIVLSVSLIITLGFGTLALNEIKITKNFTKSLKSYYVAEAGIEDILLRNNKGIKLPAANPSTLSFGEGTAIRDIGDIVAGTREIISQADVDDRIRKVKVVMTISSVGVAFHYGAQVGEGGMLMHNGSKIKGNVFSNGSILPASGGAKGTITGEVIVASNSTTYGKNKIDSLDIGGNAYTNLCEDCKKIGGELHWATGGNPGNCTADGGIIEDAETIAQKPLPVTHEQIDSWKDEASCDGNPACIYSGDYTIDIGETKSLGPIKIPGNLEIKNNATLTVTGTIYVVQDIIINKNAVIKLDSGYGATSGVIVADGLIKVENGSSIQGSGTEGSYTMLLSDKLSVDENDPAVDVSNTGVGSVFYASNGWIRLSNTANIREATGVGLYLANNAEIEYEVGLQDTSFSSGPSGGWKIANWREIE